MSNAADVESYWLKLCRIPEFRLSLQYNLTIKLTVEISFCSEESYVSNAADLESYWLKFCRIREIHLPGQNCYLLAVYDLRLDKILVLRFDCVYVFAYMNTHTYTRTHTHTLTHIHVYIYIYIYIYVCTYMYMYI